MYLVISIPMSLYFDVSPHRCIYTFVPLYRSATLYRSTAIHVDRSSDPSLDLSISRSIDHSNRHMKYLDLVVSRCIDRSRSRDPSLPLTSGYKSNPFSREV